MGRFKIYDPEKLLNIENDSHYGKCLLCERKLKNIMGNIKRHYEQMHSVYVDANAIKSKKCKKNNSKKDSETKTMFDEMLIHKRSQAKPKSKSPTCTYQNNNLNLTPISYSPKDPQMEIKLKDQIIETSAIIQQRTQVVKSLQLEPAICTSTVIQRVNKNDDFIKTNHISKNHSDELPTHLLNKSAKLIEKDDLIQIPCYSFINNIQINASESSHQLEFLKCLVETKAHVNIPLKTFENGDSFQEALKQWAPNFQFNYSPQTIGEHIDRMTKKLHQEMKKLVANRLIYLKLDIVSSTEGNIMLVNIQFIKDFHLTVITLNALELSDDGLTAYLKKKVMSTLERFKIEINNVFSIIKDNTSNVRNGLKKSGDICEYLNNTEYCQHLSSGFPGHAIHFAAIDIIVQLNENISQSRDSARKLQRQILHLKTKSTILFDNNTNWFSVYDMIESLMNIHDEIENKSLLLVEVDWVFAKKFVESFKPVVDTALMLQTYEIVLMGDFYREWLLCEMKLEELAVENELALYLLKALHKRKLEYFENASFLTALYIDPRFCYMGSMHLNDKQKEMAITQLLQIFNKLKAMHECTTTPYSTNNLKINLNNRYDKLERRIINNVKTDIVTTTNCNGVSLWDMDEQRVKESLEELQFEERIAFKTNILEYWNMAKYKNPLLVKIAEVALAAPATQATLSRALNASAITLLKCKFVNENKENLENLVLLKLNQDLVDKISLEN